MELTREQLLKLLEETREMNKVELMATVRLLVEELLKTPETIRLSSSEWDAFQKMLAEPAEPTEALKKLMNPK